MKFRNNYLQLSSKTPPALFAEEANLQLSWLWKHELCFKFSNSVLNTSVYFVDYLRH